MNNKRKMKKKKRNDWFLMNQWKEKNNWDLTLKSAPLEDMFSDSQRMITQGEIWQEALFSAYTASCRSVTATKESSISSAFPACILVICTYSI
jgi:hypothetical protein